MKQFYKPLGFILVGIVIFLVYAIGTGQEVLLESKESKTVNGGPVFNKIRFFKFKDKDVWMMNQSHHGSLSGRPDLWDRLAIVVDKTSSPKQARFFQLEPGPLIWKDGLKEKPFKVSCYMCHNNGPRAIRPNYDSPFNPTTLSERAKILYWNLQMKLYGRVIVDPTHNEKDKILSRPLRFKSPYENEHLLVSTCVKCHRDSGFLARGFLKRQQVPTIKFMLESGEMPPPGFWLSAKEKNELKMFLDGF